MRHRRWTRRAARSLAPATSVALCLACGSGTEPIPPTTGAVAVTTSTTGTDPDPDGYLLFLDGAEVRPIGPAATATLADLTPTTHLVGLTGVAANCQVQGGNPRAVTVAAGETAAEAFAVSCAEVPPDAGTLEVGVTTTGAAPDPDGYTVTLDGIGGHPIAVDGSASIQSVSPGDHLVGLEGVAANCSVAGDNPRVVAVPAGGTARTGFAVDCAATTGSLQVTIAGLPDGTGAAVTVSGPNGYEEPLAASATLGPLQPGSYSVSAGQVTSGGYLYTSDPATRSVTVAAGETAEVTVSYTGQPLPSLNLRIAGLYLTQSVQTFANDLPLVTGRDAFLRVFAQANEANTATPPVRVRLYHGGTLVQTLTIPAPGGATPTTVDEGDLGGSWNVVVPGGLIRPGLEVLAEVDPGDTVAEADETDNRFPASGGPGPIAVRTVPSLALTLVPVKQSANDLVGRVTSANQGEYLDLARRIYPIPGHDADIHAVYTTAGPLQPDDADGAWNTLVGEIDALRIAEGTGRLYYGVVRLDYSGGLTARSITGTPAAVGFDLATERARLTAHELGHMWGRDHAPCGTTQALDPGYPYPDGRIGKFGFDVEDQILKPVMTPDVMGLCKDVWISDYTWAGVMDFRGSDSPGASSAAGPQPSLLVWGRVDGGQAVLEPAFQLVTRPVLPARPGVYTIEGVTGDGARAFRVSFDPAPAADGGRRSGHFAFAVPLDPATAGRLAGLRLSGPGLGGAAVSRVPASLRSGLAPGPARLSGAPGGVALRWDAAASPAVMVRDAATGEVLSFARGGEVVMPAGRSELDLVLSDGVRSRHQRVRLPGP